MKRNGLFAREIPLVIEEAVGSNFNFNLVILYC